MSLELFRKVGNYDASNSSHFFMSLSNHIASLLRSQSLVSKTFLSNWKFQECGPSSAVLIDA